MPRAFHRRLLSVLLIPLLLMLSGIRPGTWHCADGAPCESATALACCCGCTESGAVILHQCREHAGQAVSAETCGCYYAAHSVDAQGVGPQAPAKQVAALPPAALFNAPGARSILICAPAATGSPPRYLIAPRDTRAPPLA